MQRIEDLIQKTFNGQSPPANLLSFCQQLVFTWGENHPVLLAVFRAVKINDLRLNAHEKRYLDAHVLACKSLSFSPSLAMEVTVDALASYTAHHGRHKATPARAIATRLLQVDEATPAHNEAWPQCLQSWLSMLVQKNADVDTSIRADVARVMNILCY